MNTIPRATSTLRTFGRSVLCIATLALAACGQNWQPVANYVAIGGNVTGLTGTLVLQNNGQDDLSVTTNGHFAFALQLAFGKPYVVTIKSQPANQVCTLSGATGSAGLNTAAVSITCASYVTVGGTISGLTGTVILQNNGGDTLATAANGGFTFATAIAPGSSYAVTVLTAPTGESCAVSNGAGTAATTDISNVAIVCAPFTLRPLPAIYSTGKAINYSAYRGAGPGAETPTDGHVNEDLALLHAAGYRLLRLFGSDPVSEQILRLGAANFPDMKFQLGVYIFGIDTAHNAACNSNSANTDQITTGIRLANQYANVVTVSVGNETSFFRTYMPVTCLVGYIQNVRIQVAQPVTADDDYTYYTDASSDAVLATTDFVSIHSYPMSNPNRWNWQQSSVAAGAARARAMMEASLNSNPAVSGNGSLKDTFNAVATHLYRNSAGQTVTVGASLPIVIGETGWKARQTNPNSLIEQYAATPANAKWYVDLMYGTAPGAAISYPAWQGSTGGPLTIFYFEAFDESWKGTDDGWGLWSADRTAVARYALCGTYAAFSYAGTSYPAAPACSSPESYAGAGAAP